MMERLLAAAAAIALVFVTQACSHAATRPAPPGSGGWTWVHWDRFQRANGPLNRQMSPSGLRYQVAGPVAAYVDNARYVRNPNQQYKSGADGFSILVMPFTRAQTVVAAEFAFRPGLSNGQSAVVGSTVGRLPRGSVQLWVTTTGWRVMTVTPPNPKTPPVNGISYNRLASGTFPTPLAIGTRYTVRLTLERARSAVIVQLPEGIVRTISNDDRQIGIDANWGTSPFIQIVRPKALDGDVAFSAFGAN